MRFHRRWIVAIGGVLALLLVVVILGITQASAASSSPAGKPRIDSRLYQALVSAPTDQSIPETIAALGKYRMTREKMAQQLAVARASDRHNGTLQSDRQREIVILANWERQTSLLARADREAITVDRSTVLAWITQQGVIRNQALATDPSAAAAFAALLKARGLRDAAAYDRDPNTYQAADDALRVARLYELHLGSHPTLAQRQAFLLQTIAMMPPVVYWHP